MKAETRLMRETVMQELATESPMPLSTLQVCDRVMAGGRYTEQGVLVYRVLCQLEGKGLIQRLRLDGQRSAYWRA